MDFYKSFRKSGRKKQLWKAWEQTWQHTSCLTILIRRNHFLSGTMPHPKVSHVTFILIVSTKISIYGGNRWTVLQNFLRLLPYHITYHLIFHSQQFWWFRIMLISGTELLKGKSGSLQISGPLKLQPAPKTSLSWICLFTICISCQKDIS